MEQIPLAASLRSDMGKGVARKLRAAEQIPAVLYGGGQNATSLTVAMADLEKVLRRVSGDTAFLALSVDSRPPLEALLQEMQMDNLGRKVLHLDFLQLRPDQDVTLDIPLEFQGQPQGVATGGVLHLSAHKVKLTGRVADIPPTLGVDISGLSAGMALHVADLSLPAGVRAVYDDNFALVSVAAPAKVEETPAEAEAEAKGAKPGAKAGVKAGAKGGKK